MRMACMFLTVDYGMHNVGLQMEGLMEQARVGMRLRLQSVMHVFC